MEGKKTLGEGKGQRGRKQGNDKQKVSHYFSLLKCFYKKGLGKKTKKFFYFTPR